MIQNIPQLIQYVGRGLNALVPFIILLAVLVFMYGLLRMLFGGGEQAKSEGKQIITFGVVAIAVMFSVWGLVNLLLATIPVQRYINAPQGPGVPTFK